MKRIILALFIVGISTLGRASEYPVANPSPELSSALYTLDNVGLSVSLAGNAAAIALKLPDGSTDPNTNVPATIAFRSSTQASAATFLRSVTAATGVTIPSGATLGQISNAQETTYVYALDNSGTVELAVSTVNTFDENLRQSTTTIGASSPSRQVLYSTTGRSNVPVRLLGWFKSTQGTAGTWVTNPTEISVVTASSITSNQTVAIRYNSSNSAAIGTSAGTYKFENIDYDTHGAYSTSTGVFTAPVAGKYTISVGLATANILLGGANALLSISVQKNGSNFFTPFGYAYSNSANVTPAVFATTDVQLALNDTITIQAAASSATNANSTSTYNFVSIRRIGY